MPFPKGISMKGNANSFIQDLNLVCQISFPAITVILSMFQMCVVKISFIHQLKCSKKKKNNEDADACLIDEMVRIFICGLFF